MPDTTKKKVQRKPAAKPTKAVARKPTKRAAARKMGKVKAASNGKPKAKTDGIPVAEGRTMLRRYSTLEEALAAPLGEPRIRILRFLQTVTEPVSRNVIAEKANVDYARCTSYIGSSKPEKRAANDLNETGASLISRGYVIGEKSKDGRGDVYGISADGRKAIAAIDRETAKAGKPKASRKFLPAEEAAPDEPSNGVEYVPQDNDRRQLVERQIRERRGQKQFREALRKRYGSRCLISECKVLAVLEAAHISPYRGDEDNNPANGLLLRSDIHTLFDLDLLGIEPESLRVELHPHVVKEYGRFANVVLACTAKKQPAREALRLRYEQFRLRLQQPG